MCLGVPGKVTELYEVGGLKMGRVDFGGVTREACLEYLPDLQIGEYTIVHVGFAISRLTEADAQATLALFREAGAFEEELGEEPAESSGMIGRPGG